MSERQEIEEFYGSFISKSRYARWIDDLGRRETWRETVDRYVDYVADRNDRLYPGTIANEVWEEIREAIFNLEIMPSMRGLMTAGPALDREPLAIYNCFTGSTKVITREYGPVRLNEVAGGKVTAWTNNGWRSAEAKYFGEQQTQRVTLRPTVDRSNHRIVIDVTPDHRWILHDGSETTSLSVGDKIESNPVVSARTTEYDDGVRHGIIFGDGTLNAYIESTGLYHHHVVLLGQHSDEMLSYFEKFSYAASRGGAATAYHSDRNNLKEFPVGKSSDYISGFIRGWMLADGNQINSEHPKIDSQKPGAYEWLCENASSGGYVVTGVNYNDKPTNFGERKNTLARITLRKSKEFIVESISPLDRQDVYCLVVPEEGNFTLANGLLTGNCSFVAVDDPRAFDEALYILMNGTGLGFSVEEKYVSQLPTIPLDIKQVKRTIVVDDSKAGWAEAQKELISSLYAGELPSIDITKVRPAGARLKTFGGRASGPQPLVNLLDYTIETFKGAAGRKLTPLEAHGIMCKTGEVVVVGGVRRSALISLSDLDSYEMAKAKSGAWWVANPERALANNSAVYDKKPSIGEFLQEWGNLYESKSGERGIFNKEQALKGAGSPRRDSSRIAGTNPCGEILLRNGGLCNLTEVVIKESDDGDSIMRKVQLATVLGTVQSTFTKFGYVRPMWQENAEEERLLGVSLTGQFGNELMSGKHGKRTLKSLLQTLKHLAITTNQTYADAMGINRSVAITTVKPSGTVSQLTHSAAGMHPWHSQYYLRTVRGDNKDPLTQFLKDAGIPAEPDVTKPNDTTVFTFPIAAPEGAVTRNDMSAIEHLEVWAMYKRYWTEHNPSVTISVREDEWIEVANWVYHNWDIVGGLSFLPHSEHVYQQAPYQECDETTYRQFVADMPKNVNWAMLPAYEFEDTTVGSQSLSCTSGSCELVNIGG